MIRHRTTLWKPLSVRGACSKVAAQIYASGRTFRITLDNPHPQGSGDTFYSVPDGCRIARLDSQCWPAGRAYVLGSVVMFALSVAFFIGFALLARDAGSWDVIPATVFVTVPIAIAAFELFRFSQQSVRIDAIVDETGRVRSGVFSVLGMPFCVGDQTLLARGGSAWTTHAACVEWFVGDDPRVVRPVLVCDGHQMALARAGFDLRLPEHAAWADLAAFTSGAPRRPEPTDK